MTRYSAPPSARIRKAPLTGWWKGLPLIVSVFSVLFFEAWLHTRILANHYEANSLTQRIREVEGRMDRLRGEEHRLTSMKRINAEAPDLGLIEPNPGQIEIIRALSPQEERPSEEGYAVAKRDEEADREGLFGRGRPPDPEPKGVIPALVSGTTLTPLKERSKRD